MTPPDPAAEERALLAVTAALLDMGRGIDALARPLTVLALGGVLARVVAPVPVVCLCALAVGGVAGLVACYFGVRVAFDAALFRRLLGGGEGLTSLDRPLVALGLAPERKAGRPLRDRVAGATRLLRRQGMCLAVQTTALLLAGAAAAFNRH